MKTTHTYKNLPHLLFLSAVLCIFGILFPLQAYAQHEDLLDKTWYLYKLEIDGEEYDYYALDILLDNDESRIEINDNFYDEFTTSVLFSGCPGWGLLLNIEFIENESKFILGDGVAFPFEHCQYSYYYNEYAIIEGHFHSFYHYGSIIEYSFATIDTIEYLIFTNENEDKLYYTAENLSVADFEELGFSIYPNPAQDQLNIRFVELPNNTNIEVYDVHGKLLDHTMISDLETQLDVSEYASGLYFIKLTDELKSTQVKKFIKR